MGVRLSAEINARRSRDAGARVRIWWKLTRPLSPEKVQLPAHFLDGQGEAA